MSVNVARVAVLLGAPAAVAYYNDGWLPTVGVATFAVYATLPEIGRSGPLGAGVGAGSPVAEAALAAVTTGLWVGSLGYLLGTAARLLVWACGRVGTPG